MKRLAFMLALLFGALPIASCYQTGDLGYTPFYCSKDDSLPECPDGYECDRAPPYGTGKCQGGTQGKCPCLRKCTTNDECPVEPVSGKQPVCGQANLCRL